MHLCLLTEKLFLHLVHLQLKDLNVGVMMRQKNYKIKYCFDVGIVMRLC